MCASDGLKDLWYLRSNAEDVDALDREKWSILDPENSFVVTIEYKVQEVADELFRLLQKQTPQTGFTEPRLDGSTVTVRCSRWTNIVRLEGIARGAKMNIYEKKFEKSQKK